MPILEKSSHNRGVECENPPKQPAAFAVVAKIILIFATTLFIFFGTCLPVTMNTGSGELGNPINGIIAGLIAAAVFFSAMIYFALIRGKIIAVLLMVLILIVGILIFLPMLFE